jgi:phenylacetate-CoA ligase
MNIFDRRHETIPRAELEQLQLERLQALMARLKRNVRSYRESIADTHVNSLADLASLPTITHKDLQKNLPYGLFALPLREVIRLYTVTGPDGGALVVSHTQNDLTQWGRLVARQLVAAGATANDIIQICLGDNASWAASGYVLGTGLIEATVIAEEPLHLDAQFAMLQSYRPTILVTTPSNAEALMAGMEQRRIEPQSLNLRSVILSRPVPDEFHERIRSALFATAHCTFGIDEVLNPGFCLECGEGVHHINEDHFLVESVNGELVVTTLLREAMPLLRYRTAIRGSISREKCACGRTFAALELDGRLDERMLVGEIPVYPDQISAVMKQAAPEAHLTKYEVVDRRLRLDIDITRGLFTDVMWQMINIRRKIETEFFTRLGVEAEVNFTAPR